jgi:hypothetical protein
MNVPMTQQTIILFYGLCVKNEECKKSVDSRIVVVDF